MSKRIAKNDSELYKIPGFGPASVRDLNQLGIHSLFQLIALNPEELYLKLEEKRGVHIDRCVLYGFREAVYFARGGNEPEKLKWWSWKDSNKLGIRNHQCAGIKKK